MIFEHAGRRPRISASAYVAPTAVLRGDVVVGEGAAILFGAVLTAEGGRVEIGAECVVMENAVLRGTPRHPLVLGQATLVGPRAHLSGCTVGPGCFLATGATVFNGARLGADVEVRINGTVHVNSVLLDHALVPIGWVAVGDPAEILPPGEHDRIWEIQRTLDFPGTVFRADRSVPEADRIRRYARALRRQKEDARVVADEEG